MRPVMRPATASPRDGSVTDRAFCPRRSNEQASIWCFFSIAQITAMFVGVLLMGSDKGGDGGGASRPRTRSATSAAKGRKRA